MKIKPLGRPAIDPDKSKARPQRQVRAYYDEWKAILQFAELDKSGKKDECS